MHVFISHFALIPSIKFARVFGDSIYGNGIRKIIFDFLNSENWMKCTSFASYYMLYTDGLVGSRIFLAFQGYTIFQMVCQHFKVSQPVNRA